MSAAARPQLLLEHQLDDVGEGLEQARRARRGTGRSRCWMNAATFRSVYTIAAADSSSIVNTDEHEAELDDQSQ